MILHLVTLFWLFCKTESLTCLSCTNVSLPSNCTSIMTCNARQKCYTTAVGIGKDTVFNLGCLEEQQCLGQSSSSIIGRSVGEQCSQCCAVDRCNEKLCSGGTQVTNEVGVCSDDPNYNCQQISTLFNVCKDVAHAKTACRKWCGLCDLVDGGWSLWTAWTNCDVTCGQGHVTRSRTCTDPAPAHGGLPCVGNKSETAACDLDPCPVHGGWSSWITWTSCSNTCGIGTQSRRRACDNPVPKLAGDHCFGDPVDFRACFMRSCQDGGWSLWTSWSSCTSGRKTRTRVCNNPKPSQFGRDCSGSTKEWDICQSLKGGPVAFTVTTPNSTLVNRHPLFTKIVTNVGGGYDPSTGIFTCPVAGLYEFSLSIMAKGSYVYCYIGKNGADIAYALSDSSSSHYSTAVNSVYLQLSVGDKVSLQSCNSWEHVERDFGSSFSGSLIN